MKIGSPVGIVVLLILILLGIAYSDWSSYQESKKVQITTQDMQEFDAVMNSK